MIKLRVDQSLSIELDIGMRNERAEIVQSGTVELGTRTAVVGLSLN